MNKEFTLQEIETLIREYLRGHKYGGGFLIGKYEHIALAEYIWDKGGASCQDQDTQANLKK